MRLWTAVAIWGLGLATAQQTPPVFRAGVDLVVVDVVVLDKDGQPVTNLTAADFEVSAGKRPRRIVSSEFIGVTRSRRTVTAESAALPAPSSNRQASTGRSIIFAVDVEEIRAGEGRSAMRAIGEYLDRLGPDDRVGVVSLPYGTPRVELTTNRQVVRDAVGHIAGASNRVRDQRMTPGEAAGVALGDTDALMAHWERTAGLPPSGLSGPLSGACPPPARRPFEMPATVPEGCKDAAQRAQDVHLRHTRNILDSLRALAEVMAPIDGSKALILVSQGINNDMQVRDSLRKFSDTAERSRVALYALHLDAPLVESAAGGGNTTGTRILDDRLGFDSMAEMAYTARGTAFRVVGSAAAALQRIDTELSGYYLITFERSPEDRDRDRLGIDVRVTRPGLDVRARKEVVLESASTGTKVATKAPTDAKAAMGALLKSPVSAREIGIDLDTFVFPVDGSSTDARITIAAEIAADGKPVDVGFEVKDTTGRVVADTFDPRAEIRLLPDGRGLYPVSVVVPPGSYVLTLGVIDADGRRGSVTHAVDVRAWPTGALRMGSVVFGEISGGAFRPVARVGAGAISLAVRVETHAAAAEMFENATVRVETLRLGETAVISSQAAQLVSSADPLRRAATSVLELVRLPPDAYVIRVTIEGADGRVLGQQARVLSWPGARPRP